MEKVSSSNSQGVHEPKLRFRDGSGKVFPPYCQESVGTLFYHIIRRNNEMTNKNVITNSAEFGLIPQRSFFDKDIAVEGNTEKYYIIEQGDFVYNPRKSTTAPYGPFNCYKGDVEGIVSPLYTCLKPLHKEFTNYLLWYFRSSAWYSYIYHNGAQGGARHDRVGMTNELMDGIPVNLPCLEEQEKVSKFLSLIEKRIEKQRQLVEALKSYKRGALSKLFPKKGETTPEYRFAGFTEPWKQQKWCETVDMSKEMVDPRNGIYNSLPHVAPGNIESFTGRLFDNVKTVEQEELISGKFHFHAGDIIYCKINPQLGKYYFAKFEGLTSADAYVLNAKNGVIQDFLFAVLQTKNFFDYSVSVSKRSGMPKINREELNAYLFLAPSELEQEQIGSFLMYLDHLISAQRSRIDEYERLKAGLLQQLFI